MGKECINVTVNGHRIKIYRGMQVKHALIALDCSLYERVLGGEMMVVDKAGFELGLEGGLMENADILTRPRR